MINRVNETICAEAVPLGVNVVLQSEHVRWGEFLARLQHTVNAIRPPRRLPLRADGIWIPVGSDAAVCCVHNTRSGIENAGQLVERNVANPFVEIVAAV